MPASAVWLFFQEDGGSLLFRVIVSGVLTKIFTVVSIFMAAPILMHLENNEAQLSRSACVALVLCSNMIYLFTLGACGVITVLYFEKYLTDANIVPLMILQFFALLSSAAPDPRDNESTYGSEIIPPTAFLSFSTLSIGYYVLELSITTSALLSGSILLIGGSILALLVADKFKG